MKSGNWQKVGISREKEDKHSIEICVISYTCKQNYSGYSRQLTILFKKFPPPTHTNKLMKNILFIYWELIGLYIGIIF